jgi:hypothetical protein
MAKRQRTPQSNREGNLLDAIAEIVHQGYGRLIDVNELCTVTDEWQPNSSMNFDYWFAWNPSFDPSSIEINWKRPQVGILRSVVKNSIREKRILSGSPMTKGEQQAYRLELARRKHGYQSAEECLESGTDCKWADLSFVRDSMEREVYILEIGDAASGKNEDVESIIERHEEIWQWKSQPLTIAGPFASPDEAEKWMAENGAFEEVD